MTQENKDILLRLIAQHKKLGISEQIDYEKFYLYSKWSIKPSLADKLSDILFFMVDKEEITTETIIHQFGFTATTAKRYLRQLTEFGYLEAKGGNRNRTYIILKPIS